MRRIFIFIFFLWTATAAFGQKGTCRVWGTVTDAGNRPLASATVSLRSVDSAGAQSADASAPARTTLADENGRFYFRHLPAGRYQLTASSTGYTTSRSGSLTLDSTHTAICLPAIVLLAKKAALKEVIVLASKPMLERRVDRTIVFVDAMTGGVGGSALEALTKSPGVTLDSKGDISLNGKGGVVVLIDDRPTHLSAADLEAYLRSLPAAVVDKIELISNPPAKYDASGSAVINLQLKKSRQPGFMGNLSTGYSQGRYAGVNTGLNANYKKGKWNGYGNFSNSVNENFSTEQYQRDFFGADGTPTANLQTDSRYRVRTTGWIGRVGLDYYPSARTTLGLMLTGSTRPKMDRLQFHTAHRGAEDRLDSIGQGYTDSEQQWRSAGLNLNFVHRFDSHGRQLSADLDALRYHSITDQFAPFRMLARDSLFPRDAAEQQTITSGTRLYSAKLDYTHPLAAGLRLDGGLKFSSVTTDNDAIALAQVGGSWTVDPARANHFLYKETIQALYASATRDWKRWSLQGGLRTEHTALNGHLLGNDLVKDSGFQRTYTDVFPTVFILHRLDSSGHHTVKLSYERRIRRPNYQQLNPFTVLRDRYSYTNGNPHLLPHYNYFAELEYSYKQFFGVSLLYGQVDRMIQNLTRAAADSFITRPENFGSNRFINLVPHVNVSPLKGWNLNATLILFHLANKGVAYGQQINNQVTTGELQLNNGFRFKNDWSAEVTGFYASTHKSGQTITDPFWTASLAVQKLFWAKKATLRLGLDDIFYTRRLQTTTLGLHGAGSIQTSRSDTRRVRLAFNYRFGSPAAARKRSRDSGGAREEEGRAN